MRVLSTFDNALSVNTKAKQQRQQGSRLVPPELSQKHREAPIQESLSRSEILRRLERGREQFAKVEGDQEVVLSRASWDDADDEEVHAKAQQKAEAVASDIGKNDPSNEDTREKLRQILSAGGSQFSDKERETLSAILIS